ncbi:twin-arginine translocase TatA/TatE family subunit [Brucella gallinifaecis]|uniref:Sec-independent protein translocase protein TatA n=1 Tax=Brucella gallinifaecis TaxID=215590 RepID=A0A502BN34_9HYPH|nr:twin-arginine translocase TatA/TatE family subunit [Brucella gallinifaecis]TPF75149.1 twin-arginine translocase TatA/TatE family subunit [Brucella gallinifaecis]
MGSFSIWHWLIVLAVVLLLFGRGKIPELMGDVAKGIKNFKQGMSDEDAAKEDAKADADNSARTIDARADDAVKDVKKTTKS